MKLRIKKIKELKMVAVALVVLCIAYSIISSYFEWKAVFMDNGQVYFGKFINIPLVETIALRNVYYIQNGGGENNQDVVVVKMRDAVHGPKNKMIINKDHILYWQELRSDSMLVQKI